MTENDQRFAIAEACGYVWYRLPNKPGDDRLYRMLAHPALQEYEGQHECWKIRADGTERICNIKYMEVNGYLPDYLRNLNSIHEAIMSQPQEVRDKINGTLMEMMRPNDAHVLDRTINATAAQRAEAFLKAKGLWKE